MFARATLQDVNLTDCSCPGPKDLLSIKIRQQNSDHLFSSRRALLVSMKISDPSSIAWFLSSKCFSLGTFLWSQSYWYPLSNLQYILYSLSTTIFGVGISYPVFLCKSNGNKADDIECGLSWASATFCSLRRLRWLVTPIAASTYYYPRLTRFLKGYELLQHQW
jgi:hypothetical protein